MTGPYSGSVSETLHGTQEMVSYALGVWPSKCGYETKFADPAKNREVLDSARVLVSALGLEPRTP